MPGLTGQISKVAQSIHLEETVANVNIMFERKPCNPFSTAFPPRFFHHCPTNSTIPPSFQPQPLQIQPLLPQRPTLLPPHCLLRTQIISTSSLAAGHQLPQLLCHDSRVVAFEKRITLFAEVFVRDRVSVRGELFVGSWACVTSGRKGWCWGCGK